MDYSNRRSRQEILTYLSDDLIWTTFTGMVKNVVGCHNHYPILYFD